MRSSTYVKPVNGIFTLTGLTVAFDAVKGC